MVDFYRELIESENCEVEFVFANTDFIYKSYKQKSHYSKYLVVKGDYKKPYCMI